MTAAPLRPLVRGHDDGGAVPALPDLFTLKDAGRSDALTHLRASTVQSVHNLIQVVADQRPEFSWNDVRAILPDGIKQILALTHHRNAPGGLMTSAAKRFGYVPCGFTISTDPDARGRAIRVWRKA